MNPKEQKRPSQGGARLQKSEKGPAPSAKAPRQKPNKPARTPKQKLLHILFIVITVLAALVVAGFIIWNIFIDKPELPVHTPRPQPTGAGNVVIDGREPTTVNSDRKEDFWTFLVVGRDTYGGGNTDTILLVAYDIPNQKLSVMSIPRDTIVNVPWDIKKINSVYNYAPYYDKDGIEFLKEEIAQFVGFEPDFTIVVEWEAVGDLVDAIGGVYFDVPRRMYYNDLSQNFKINLQKGYQLLDGSKAMQLIRYRHDSDDSGHILNSGYADGDLGRIKVQQDFLKAVVSQCLQIKNVGRINELAKVFTENVTTELTINNLAWFAQQAILGGLDMENVSFNTMPWVSADNVYSRTYHNYPSYVAPDAEKVLELINESFNPYKDDIRMEELDVILVDSSGRLSSTSGHLEDSQANSARPSGGSGSSSSARPTPTPEPTPEPTPDGEGGKPIDDPEATPTPRPSDSGSGSSGGPAPGSTPVPEEPPETEAPTPTGDPEPPEPTPAPVAEPEPPPAEEPVPTSGPGMEPTE